MLFLSHVDLMIQLVIQHAFADSRTSEGNKKEGCHHSEKEAEFMFSGLMAHVFWPA